MKKARPILLTKCDNFGDLLIISVYKSRTTWTTGIRSCVCFGIVIYLFIITEPRGSSGTHKRNLCTKRPEQTKYLNRCILKVSFRTVIAKNCNFQCKSYLQRNWSRGWREGPSRFEIALTSPRRATSSSINAMIACMDLRVIARVITSFWAAMSLPSSLLNKIVFEAMCC